jgi:hypothetical protein
MRSLSGPFGPGRRRWLGEKHAVLSLAQHTVEMQQSGRLQNDGGTKDTCRAHEQGAQPAMIRSLARRLGARLRPRLRMSS